ncbi:hypothetical protein RND81_11G059000 [Saponaria officinalis]|uniref:Uncharacterized protein n=1 Tax=Saponaria officinalis TaxID=3572 RepID=A0AAW1HIB7_SAPOF
MASPPTMSLFFFSFLFMLLATEGSDIIRMKESSEIREKHLKEDLKPTVWPEQFHSLLVMSNAKTMEMQVANLWYDWPNKRNLHIIQYQLGKKLYDAEYDNHTSFFFTRDDTRECRTAEVEVGILTPNWLHGATYLGQQQVDGGFLCNVWEKVEFIWYYEDVVSKRPVQWIFYTGRTVRVMSFEVGAVLEDSEWQAPVYCFDKEETSIGRSHRILRPLPLSSV